MDNPAGDLSSLPDQSQVLPPLPPISPQPAPPPPHRAKKTFLIGGAILVFLLFVTAVSAYFIQKGGFGLQKKAANCTVNEFDCGGGCIKIGDCCCSAEKWGECKMADGSTGFEGFDKDGNRCGCCARGIVQSTPTPEPTNTPTPTPSPSCTTSSWDTTCGYVGKNWCAPTPGAERDCVTDWVDGPQIDVLVPAIAKLRNSGTYCTREDGKKKFQGKVSYTVSCGECNAPCCSGLTVTPNTAQPLQELTFTYNASPADARRHLYYRRQGETSWTTGSNLTLTGNKFVAPSAPGTWEYVLNVYNSSCTGFCNWDGKWHTADTCPTTSYSFISSGCSGCNTTLTVVASPTTTLSPALVCCCGNPDTCYGCQFAESGMCGAFGTRVAPASCCGPTPTALPTAIPTTPAVCNRIEILKSGVLVNDLSTLRLGDKIKVRVQFSTAVNDVAVKIVKDNIVVRDLRRSSFPATGEAVSWTTPEEYTIEAGNYEIQAFIKIGTSWR